MGMTIFEMVKKNISGAKNKGEAVMWISLKRLSDALDGMREAHPEEYWTLLNGMYEDMMGPHYNEDFAEWQVCRMYFKDKSGKEHRGGHWSLEEAAEVFEKIKARIPQTCNRCDWYVTINMIWTDNLCLYKEWWPDAPESVIEQKVVEAAINWLADIDAPEGHIWKYFNH